MPPVSQAQRAAMHAAAEGHSTIGIPQSVGQEFSQAEAAHSSNPTERKRANLAKTLKKLNHK